MGVQHVVTRGYGTGSLTGDVNVVVTRGYAITPSATPSATAGGSVAGAGEVNIVDGGRTVVLELQDTIWVAAGATFDAERTNIIAGLTEAGSQPDGWNARVKPALQSALSSVVRTNDYTVTITLPAVPAYDISSAEIVTATIPASAVTIGGPIVASPPLFIFTGGAADATGTGQASMSRRSAQHTWRMGRH